MDFCVLPHLPSLGRSSFWMDDVKMGSVAAAMQVKQKYFFKK